MPTTIPSVHLQEDDLIVLLAREILPRNYTGFLQPLNKPKGEDPLVEEFASSVQT